MSYEPESGRPLKNLIYYLTHPFKMMDEKPGLLVVFAVPAVYFLGVWQDWWPNILMNFFNKG